MGVSGQILQPSSYKVNKFWGYINNNSLAIMLTVPYGYLKVLTTHVHSYNSVR